MINAAEKPSNAIQVILVEDEPLFRDLLRRACLSEGIRVWRDVSRGEEAIDLLSQAAPHGPAIDLAIIDIELADGMNGVATACRLREIRPEIGILLLSNHRLPAYLTLLETFERRGFSYLQKSSVRDFDALRRAALATAKGGVVVDSDFLEDGSSSRGVVGRLTDRQRDILSLAAQGYSNSGIATKLHLSPRTVENHLANIYAEFGIDNDPAIQPRVQAVVTYLADLFPVYFRDFRPDRGVNGAS